MKLRYVDVSANLVGKDRVGNKVILPLQTEQTIVGFFEHVNEGRGTLVCGSNKFHQVTLASFIDEEDQHPIGQS